MSLSLAGLGALPTALAQRLQRARFLLMALLVGCKAVPAERGRRLLPASGNGASWHHDVCTPALLLTGAVGLGEHDHRVLRHLLVHHAHIIGARRHGTHAGGAATGLGDCEEGRREGRCITLRGTQLSICTNACALRCNIPARSHPSIQINQTTPGPCLLSEPLPCHCRCHRRR